MSANKREVLQSEQRDKVVAALQPCLYDMISLSLQGKQAHWNVKGARFRSVHLELDEIIDSTRLAADDIAERIVALGVPADGRPSEVASNSRLDSYPEGLQSVESTVTNYSDRLATAIHGLRESITVAGEHDPVSEDLLIGVSGKLEKHLWMLQSQEES